MSKNLVKAGVAGVYGKNRLAVEYVSAQGDSIPELRGNSGDTGSGAATFRMTTKEDDSQAVTCGNYRVSPWGPDNKFPNTMRQLFENNLAPGLLDFKVDMIYAQGITLVNGKTEEEQDFIEEQKWLDSWDVFTYILSQITDFITYENVMGQVRRSLKGKITDILHVNATECRLEIMKKNRVENIIVGDYENSSSNFKAYKTWNPFLERETGKVLNAISMYHGKKPTAGFRYYNYPVFIGVLNTWLPVANLIPTYHYSMLKNALMAVYHVRIPLEPLLKLAEVKGWKQEEMDAFVQSKLQEIDEMLCGASNAGKTFYTFSVNDASGKPMIWEIILIDNKIKETSESFLQLYNDCNQALTSAFQVQPSLASIQLGNKMSSGSEVLNAFNLHVKTRTPIARQIILNPINSALRINFPNTKAKVVFKDIALVHQAKDKSGVEE